MGSHCFRHCKNDPKKNRVGIKIGIKIQVVQTERERTEDVVDGRGCSNACQNVVVAFLSGSTHLMVVGGDGSRPPQCLLLSCFCYS